MTDRDPKTGRFVRPEADEIPPFDRPDYPQQPAWTARDTAWAVAGVVGLIAAFIAALIL